MKGVIEIEIGGQKRTLDFTRNGFAEHIKDAIGGGNPLAWFKKFEPKNGEKDTVQAELEDIAVIIYAGINSHLDVIEEDNIPFPKVKKWVRAGKMNEFGVVVKEVFAALNELNEETVKTTAQ